jgi:hypothetical protein
MMCKRLSGSGLGGHRFRRPGLIPRKVLGKGFADHFSFLTFAETQRQEGLSAQDAAIEGAASRLRPILMTSCAMIAGMLSMALALGEAGQQNAPLERAVIGGLIAATFATLFVLPSLFSMIQNRASIASASLDPTDPDGSHYGPAREV